MRVITISDGQITQDAIFDENIEKFDPLGLGPSSKVVGHSYTEK